MKKQNVVVLERPKGIFKHVGLAVEGNRVLHNTPEKGEHISTLYEFSAGRPVTAMPKKIDDDPQLSSRLNNTINSQRKYDLLENNCEHTISRILDGERRSDQLRNVLCIMFFLGAVCILYRAKR